MYSNTKSTINKYAIKKIIKNKIYRIISSQKGTLIYVSIIIKLEKPAKKSNTSLYYLKIVLLLNQF